MESKRKVDNWTRVPLWSILFLFGHAGLAQADLKEKIQHQDIHLVWMGGDDCPPCRGWRISEFPKLQQSPDFQRIRFSYVVKAVRSSVPAGFFLPEEVKPLKEKLDIASSGRSGSPQGAVIVKGEVYDYFHGVRSAEEIENMLRAIIRGTPYPFTRCIVASKTWRECETPASN
jgi:hypothetical protein